MISSLPPLAKQYVLRLLWVENAVPLKSWQEWARPEALSKHQIAIDRLEQLRVILPERSDLSNSTHYLSMVNICPCTVPYLPFQVERVTSLFS